MKNSKLKTNMIYQVSYEVLVIVLPLIISPYISRVLGADKLGTYSYTYSIANYFVLFSMLGIKTYGNRTIAQVRDNKEKLNQTFSDLLSLHIGISAICTLCYIVFIIIGSSAYRTYLIIHLLLVLSALFDISWFYFGIEQFKTSVLRNIFVKLLNLVLIFTLVKDADDLIAYCIIMSGCTLLSQLLLWFPLRKYIALVKPDLNNILKHFKPMAVMFIPTIAVSLYRYMDKVMLGAMSDTVEVGYYSNADQLMNVPTAIISAFGTVMLPRMSNLISSNNEGFKKYLDMSMRYLMCLSIGMAFGLAGVAQIFAPIFWGNEFIVSGNLVMWLAIAIPFMGFANILRTQYIIPNNHDRIYIISVVSGAIINIILNAIFIPNLGSMGAVIGTICAESSVCIIQSVAVSKELPLLSYFKHMFPYIIFGMIMFIVVKRLPNICGGGLMTLILQVLIGVCIYGILCGVYWIITKDSLVTGLLKKIKKDGKH